jgi:uncharacterized membrane protein (GlpM family)
MAKHMAEGTRFPIFFYGQSYMGSLEPMVSALLVFLFGANGFLVCLGPVLVANLSLYMWYLYALDTGDRSSALGALGLCVIGPSCFFMFQFAPRGGYMAALFFCAYILRTSSRIAKDLWMGLPLKSTRFLCLGLAVGLSLWSHLISISATFSAILILFIGMKGRIWRYPIGALLGVIGTFAGLAPWLIYNFQNDWDSLKIAHNLTFRHLLEGMGLLKARWIYMIGFEFSPSLLVWVIGIGYSLLIAGGLFKYLTDLYLRPKEPLKLFAWGGLFSFLGFSTLLFLYSEYAEMHTARCLIPLVPALAVVAGYVFSQGTPRILHRLCLLLLLGLITSQFSIFKTVYHQASTVADKYQGHQEILSALDASGVSELYADKKHYFLNFMTGEAFTFASGEEVFLEKNTEKVEFSENVGVLKNYRSVETFLQMTDGHTDKETFAGGSIHFRFQAPRFGLKQLNREQIQSIQVNGLRNETLTDLNFASGVGYETEADIFSVFVVFHQAHSLAKGRFQFNLSPHRGDGNFSDTFTLSVRHPGKPGWTEVYQNQSIPPYFWSGPRLYYAGRRFRFEFVLPDEPIMALRIQFNHPAGPEHSDLQVVEMEFFEHDPEHLQSESEAFSDLRSLLKDLSLNRVYADRWVSNQLFKTVAGDIDVELFSATKIDGGLPPSGGVIWDPQSGFLIHQSDLPASLKVAEQSGLSVTSMPLGPWTLLVPVEAIPEPGPVYWSGYGLRFNGLPL